MLICWPATYLFIRATVKLWNMIACPVAATRLGWWIWLSLPGRDRAYRFRALRFTGDPLETLAGGEAGV